MSDHHCKIEFSNETIEEILREHTGVSDLTIVIANASSWHAEGTVPIACLAPKTAPRKRRSKKEPS